MSGPKLSAAEIEAQRRAQLERERQERLRRLREAQSKYNTAKAYVVEHRMQLSEFLDDSIAAIRAVSTAGADTLMTAINKILARMDMNPVANSASKEAWIDSAIKSQERVLKLFNEGKMLIEQEANRIGVYNARALTAAQHASASNSIENAVRGDTQVQKSIEFTPIPTDSIEVHLSSCLSELRELLDHKQTPMLKTTAALVREVKRILTNTEHGQENNIEREAQDIINREQDLIDEIEECKELYEEYYAVAAIVNAEPLDLTDFSGAEMLEQEMNDLKCRYQREDEMDYIADQVNQVMLELGYEFVSSHVLQQESEKDMSVYSADEETGVVVYTGENGEVMMQVVSLGDTEEMSDEEIEESLDLQLSFCSSHQDIVDELRNRGILLRQMNYQPPRREHAKKICTSEFSPESRKTVTRRKRRYDSRKAVCKMQKAL